MSSKTKVMAAAGCVAFFTGMGAPLAQTAIDSGEYLAVRHCIDCHEIGPGHASFKLVKSAPSFASIANDPEKGNEAYLKHLLGAGSHSLMLDHAGGSLDRNQVNGIIRYILGLKK